MAEKKLVYFQMYTSFKMIKVECSSWFVLVYSVCWKQTESTWDTNQLLPFAVMHLEFFSEKITTILTILLHFWIKTYDKITDTLGKLKPWRDPCPETSMTLKKTVILWVAFLRLFVSSMHIFKCPRGNSPSSRNPPFWKNPLNDCLSTSPLGFV